jgi:signal transduction histidine kinase
MPADRFCGPRQFRLLFITTMAVLSLTLAWLGWRVLQQDEQLEVRSRADRRDAAADLAVAALERRLTAVEQDLADLLTSGEPASTATLPDGAVIVGVRSGEFRAWPTGRLVYYPYPSDLPTARPQAFARADDLELLGDHEGAIAALRPLLDAEPPHLKAAAITRVARNYLNSGRYPQALEWYGRLSALGAVPVAGMPAALAAHVGRLAVYERQQARTRVDETGRQLDEDLHSGRWPVTAATYAYLVSRVGTTSSEIRGAARDRVTLSEALETLWQEGTGGLREPSGRRSLVTSSGAVLLVWRSAGEATAIFAATAAHLNARWLAPGNLPVSLQDSNGRAVAGPVVDRTAGVTRAPSATGLPWTVVLLPRDDPPADRSFATRRWLLVSGLGVMLGVIVAGAWFVGRSVSRELEVARLQSDFVSAVSHDFRTPLTTLCQLSELLKRGRVPSESDRQTYYEFLHAESDRLRRLVEGLLNFGRLQTGKTEFRRVPLDAAALAEHSAAEFSQSQRSSTHRVIVGPSSEPLMVEGDSEALQCALWNLLENAVKYSPEASEVRVDVRTRRDTVEICVEDDGIGIPRDEQRRIFDRFTRGAIARERQISGTGIGLATAREIVRAHGGEIAVESEPGRGSTFTIRLPAHQGASVPVSTGAPSGSSSRA